MRPYSFINDMKNIFPLFGELILAFSIIYAIPSLIIIIYPWETTFSKYFTIPSFVLFIISIIILSFTKHPERITMRQAMEFATFSWILVSVLSVIPFMYIDHMTFTNALFETISAWTGTGLTVMTNIDTAPRMLIFWRSLMQWIGGLGVVVLGLLVLRYPGLSKSLYQAEARNDIIVPNAVNTSKILFEVYAILTLIGAVLLWALGMTPFDALNYTMTGLGTGGMAPHAASVAYYTSKTIHVAIIVLMILGATNFASIYSSVAKKNPKHLLKDKQFISLIMIPIVFAAVYYIPIYGYKIVFNGVIETLFQEYSAISCTGFNTVDITSLPDPSKVALSFLMIIGGSTGSTAGAIKIYRFLVLLATIKWFVKKNTYPESVVVPITFNGKPMKEEVALQALSYALLYLGILSVGTIVTMMYLNTTFVNALFENASAIGNVGLSVGITSPTMPALIKDLFMLEMLLGRLEIFTMIVAFAAIVRK